MIIKWIEFNGNGNFEWFVVDNEFVDVKEEMREMLGAWYNLEDDVRWIGV